MDSLRRFSACLCFAPALAWAGTARAECPPARVDPSATAATDARPLPAAWQSALDRLIASTSEPGHPWSCAGGRLALELTPAGAVLHVTRDGEVVVRRSVTTPDDVVPLGEALLAMPLAPPSTAEPPPPAPSLAPIVVPPALGSPADRTAAIPRPVAPPRILLGGGVDGRVVGSSGAGWVGPTLSAAVPMGRWLPGISLRQQSPIFVEGPPIDELSFALALQRRFPVSRFELRTGVALRGAVVLRDLPRPQGSQSQLQGRAGVLGAIAIPIARWGNLVIGADADVVGLSRSSADPAATSVAVQRFPTFTVGGSLGLEVPL